MSCCPSALLLFNYPCATLKQNSAGQGERGKGKGGMLPKQALIDLDLDFQLVSASVLVSGCALWRRVVLLCRKRN